MRERIREIIMQTCSEMGLTCAQVPSSFARSLGVKSLTLGRHLVHRLSLQKFHRCQVAQC